MQKCTFIALSAAALLAATINGSQTDSIQKITMDSLSGIDASKYDTIGMIYSEKGDAVILKSINSGSLAYDSKRDSKLLALVLSDKETGAISMLHILKDIDETAEMQTKYVAFAARNNGTFFISATPDDTINKAQAQIHSDGATLKLTDTDGKVKYLKEPMIDQPIGLVVCSKNFKPLNIAAYTGTDYGRLSKSTQTA